MELTQDQYSLLSYGSKHSQFAGAQCTLGRSMAASGGGSLLGLASQMNEAVPAPLRRSRLADCPFRVAAGGAADRLCRRTHSDGSCIRGQRTRQLALELGFAPVVPPLSSRVAPWEYDKELYEAQRGRAAVPTKGFRRIFSRFDNSSWCWRSMRVNGPTFR